MPEPLPFKTIIKSSGPFLYKDRKSKFLGWVFPAKSPDHAIKRVETLREKYPDATHICYAYRTGVEKPMVRMNDDGEPAYSAGTPIYHQIESEELFNVLVCVVRYYGGTKLGVGGLIQAYREAARGVLEEARIVTRVPVCILTLDFEYPLLDAVMRFISQHQLKLRSQR
ncbi:MAG: YigZ family protein, partial [Robiginitalea sp.]